MFKKKKQTNKNLPLCLFSSLSRQGLIVLSVIHHFPALINGASPKLAAAAQTIKGTKASVEKIKNDEAIQLQKF